MIFKHNINLIQKIRKKKLLFLFYEGALILSDVYDLIYIMYFIYLKFNLSKYLMENYKYLYIYGLY